MITERWLIHGRVQGVGYRDWMVREAHRHAVAGWVRNRGDSDVEAVVQGSEEAIARLHAACRRGPPPASVTSIGREPADALRDTGFTRRASC